MNFMSEIAILGDRTSVLGFKALGLDAYPVSKGQAKDIWPDLIKGDYSVIFVTEEVHEEIKELISEVSQNLTPAVVVIPPTTGSTGLGMQRLKKIVEKAVGVDILSREQG